MKLPICIVLLFVAAIQCRYMSAIELDKTLLQGGAETTDMPVWSCIVKKESDHNTAYWDHETEEMGIFAIADVSCMPNRDMSHELSCDINCDKLRDDDINDDLECALKLHALYEKLTGDGFSYWAAFIDGSCRNYYGDIRKKK